MRSLAPLRSAAGRTGGLESTAGLLFPKRLKGHAASGAMASLAHEPARRLVSGHVQVNVTSLPTAITAPSDSSKAIGRHGQTFQPASSAQLTGRPGTFRDLISSARPSLAGHDRPEIRVARFAKCSGICRATRPKTQVINCPDLSLSMVALGR